MQLKYDNLDTKPQSDKYNHTEPPLRKFNRGTFQRPVGFHARSQEILVGANYDPLIFTQRRYSAR